ncbi:MAG TPA: mechanosensitive ion channel domain-containing protein [Cellvibrio sp.]|nr:mechanosensitive ion channel domain-containing protein [Cellvibrio sp.]
MQVFKHPVRMAACLLFLFFLSLVPWSIALAAEVSDTSLEASTLKTHKAIAIPISEIINRANDEQRLLGRVARRVQADNPTAQLASALDEIASSVNNKNKAFSVDQLRSLPVMRLESLDRHWQFDERQFDRWQNDLREITAPYTELADQLAQHYADWAATKSAVDTSSLPDALTNQIDGMLTELRDAERSLSEPLAQLSALARRGNTVDASIQAGRNDVAVAIKMIDRRLLSLDVEPLWRIESWQAASKNSFQSIEGGLEVEARFAQDYSRVKAGLVQGVRVLQVGLLILLIWMARLYYRTPALAQDDVTRRILTRPISSWLLLSMLMIMAFESSAPLILMEFAFLIALIPLVRLVPPQSVKLLGASPYAAIGLYVLDRLGFLLMDSSYLYRLFVFGLAVLALMMTLALLWRWRVQVSSSLSVQARLRVRAVGWLASLILLISIVANVVGNLSLAEMLVGGLIDSGYMGLLLYTGITVSMALLKVIMAQPFMLKWTFVRLQTVAIERVLLHVLSLGALLIWVIYTMDRFRILRPIYSSLSDLLGFTVEVGEIAISLGNVLVFFIAVLVSVWVARLIRLLLRDQLLSHVSLPRGVGNSIASLSYYAVLLLGFLIALSAAGFKVSQLALVFGALGVGIGFGLQGIVSNFVSGLVLMFERPIQPGDIIEMPGVSGRVRQIGMRATIISTFDGADVVVPNGTLVANNVTNWTLTDSRRRIDLDISVAYGSDLQTLLPLLISTAGAIPGVISEPAPVALLKGYGPSSLDFMVRVWTYDMDGWVKIRSDLYAKILEELGKAGIEIPYAQYDLNLRTISEKAEDVLRGSKPGADE